MENGGTSVRIGLCCIIAGAGAALSVAACTDGPGIEQRSLTSLSQAFCEKMLECGCAPLFAASGFVVPTSCDGWNLDDFDSGGYDEYGGDFGEDNGDDRNDETQGGDISHQFDQGCVDRLAERLVQSSCDRLVPVDCHDYCKLFYGTRFEGEPCDDSSDCVQGLLCAGECRDPCKVQTVGEGENCEFASCEAGLSCSEDENDPDRPNTCVRGGGDGEFCDGEICEPDSYCDQGIQCRPRGDVGNACMGHRECTSLFCPAGFCAELPGDGEPCSVQLGCRSGTLCLPNGDNPSGTCTAIAPLCNPLSSVPQLVLGG